MGRSKETVKLTVTDIARVCHEANRALCLGMGDYTQVLWANAPKWQCDSAVAGVQFRLDNPEATPEDQHEAWAKAKRDAGWVYGEVKDSLAKTHPCLVPYLQLPTAQQAKDKLFANIVDALKHLL